MADKKPEVGKLTSSSTGKSLASCVSIDQRIEHLLRYCYAEAGEKLNIFLSQQVYG